MRGSVFLLLVVGLTGCGKKPTTSTGAVEPPKAAEPPASVTLPGGRPPTAPQPADAGQGGAPGNGNGFLNARDMMRAQNALKALSLDYLAYQNSRGAPPASAAEMARGIEEARLRPGEVDTLTVQWGAKLDVKGGGTRLLAHANPIGGQVAVMMQDGSVKTVAEDQLTKLPKAEPVKKP